MNTATTMMKSLVRMSFATMRRLLLVATAAVAAPFILVLIATITVVTAITDGLYYLHDWSHGLTEGRDTFIREFWAERLSDIVDEMKWIVAFFLTG